MQKTRIFKRHKIKKRPYHKKTNASHIRLAKSTFIGIIPLIIICIGLATTLIINDRLLDRYSNLQLAIKLPHYSLPQVSIQINEKPLIQLIGQLISVFTSIKISFPKFTLPTITLPAISFPNIDISPVVKLIQYLIQQMLQFIALLNPLPLLQAIKKGIIILFATEATIFLANITQTMLILTTCVNGSIVFLQHIIIGIKEMCVYTAEIILLFIHKAINASLMLISELVALVQLATAALLKDIQTDILYIAVKTKDFLSFVAHLCIMLTLTIWKAILTPFIAIQNQYLRIAPYVNWFGAKLAKATQDLFQNIGDILSFASTIAKQVNR